MLTSWEILELFDEDQLHLLPEPRMSCYTLFLPEDLYHLTLALSPAVKQTQFNKTNPEKETIFNFNKAGNYKIIPSFLKLFF